VLVETELVAFIWDITDYLLIFCEYISNCIQSICCSIHKSHWRCVYVVWRTSHADRQTNHK